MKIVKSVWNGKKMKQRWEVEARVRRIKKGERSLGWKTQKFTPGRLRMGSVFGCGRVSFGESPRTIVHCMTVCHTFMCIHVIVEYCEIGYKIIYIKLCGLIDTVELFLWCWSVLFVFFELSNPFNPLGVRHPTEQCGNAHPFLVTPF